VQVYIFRLNGTGDPSSTDHLSDFVLNVRQGSRHAVVASLINVSAGGSSSSAQSFLDRWEDFVAEDYRFGMCSLNSSPAAQAPYSEGTWLDWGTDGVGVSSAYSDFTLNISGRNAEVDLGFSVNTTTKVELAGSYADVGGNNKTVSVRMDLSNEDSPALAGPRTLEYRGYTDPQTYLIRPSAATDVINQWDGESSGWDGDNATSATETQSKVDNDIYWTTWNNSDMGNITRVDLRIRLDFVISSIKSGSDSVTVQWWVGGQQGSGTYTIDSTNDGPDLSVSFDDVTEPTDGSWTWADLGNVEIRLIGTKVGGYDTIAYGVDEVWGWVTAAGTVWQDASLEEGYTEQDYGNGTYAYFFNVTLPGTHLEVRMQTYDRRGVFVQTESTLPEI